MLPGETIRSGADATGVSEFKVMESPAGFYIGTTYFDDECGCDLPYSRESDYYASEAEAKAALANECVNWR